LLLQHQLFPAARRDTWLKKKAKRATSRNNSGQIKKAQWAGPTIKHHTADNVAATGTPTPVSLTRSCVQLKIRLWLPQWQQSWTHLISIPLQRKLRVFFWSMAIGSAAKKCTFALLLLFLKELNWILFLKRNWILFLKLNQTWILSLNPSANSKQWMLWMSLKTQIGWREQSSISRLWHPIRPEDT
jgi:hypothetical protein